MDRHLGLESPSHLGLATWSFGKSCGTVFPSGRPLSAFQAAEVRASQRLHPNRCEGRHPGGFHLHFPWSQITGSLFSPAYRSHAYLRSAQFPHTPSRAQSPADKLLSIEILRYFLPGHEPAFYFCLKFRRKWLNFNCVIYQFKKCPVHVSNISLSNLCFSRGVPSAAVMVHKRLAFLCYLLIFIL